jgi:hypothetical protein
MQPVRQSILLRPRPRPSCAQANVESARSQHDAEEARVAALKARLWRYEDQLLPTPAEDAARKRDVFLEAQAQVELRRAAREQEQAQLRAPPPTPQLSSIDLLGCAGAAERGVTRLQAERALLAENQRLAEERVAAHKAAQQAERAAERADAQLEWWDRTARRRSAR